MSLKVDISRLSFFCEEVVDYLDFVAGNRTDAFQIPYSSSIGTLFS